MTLAYVRDVIEEARPAPLRSTGIAGWMRRNLFSTPLDSLLTLAGVLMLVWMVPPVYGFLMPGSLGGAAVPPGGTVADCRMPGAGACWAYVSARISFFIYGFYPAEEYWRPNIVFALGALLIVPLLIPRAPFKRLNAILFFVVYPVVCFYLLNGIGLVVRPGDGLYPLLDGLGLLAADRTLSDGAMRFMAEVPTEQWGGLLVTLVVSLIGIICSMPIGILLALGRQSKLPVIKTLCVMFIELWRAVPLITILFMASVMLPLFMPQGMSIDKLLRALVGITLFFSAYLAEVVRGGLQALPRGQYEAASALGLNYWKSTVFIILPQALKHVIPGIVNTFIALFKDTSLISMVGIFDLLNTVHASNSDAAWGSPNQAITGYVFAAAVFWVFCFSMSRYSIFMERRLDTGHKG